MNTSSMWIDGDAASKQQAPDVLDHADSKAQPKPTGNGPSVTDAVLADIAARRDFGAKKYGTELRAHNGRDALVDAYQEALDLVVYLKQELMERDAARTAK